MDDGLRSERLALPLAEAAARLGISAEALCQRLDRGEAQGFERDGTPFVYVDGLTAKMGAAKMGAAKGLTAEGLAAERRFGGASAAPPTDGTLPVVVEFQKMELTRLLRENERLNTRLDQLFDEMRHLRDMQQREQVLRQQEQALRRQNQETLDRLTSRPALPAPDRPETPDAPEMDKPRPELVLTRAVVTKRPTAEHRVTEHRATKHFAKSRPESGPESGPESRREPHAVMPKPAPGKPATRGLVAKPTTARRSSPATRVVADGTIKPEEAAELAMILNDIGHSLRDSEAFRRYPPIKPGAVPQRAGDRRPTSAPEPIRARASIRPNALPAKTLSAEEVALVAILDSMGPTAEDRRTAARNVRALLRMPTGVGES